MSTLLLTKHRTVVRLVAALAVGIMFAAYEDYFGKTRAIPSDLTQPWLAARLLMEGRNPYREIGPDGPVRHQFHLIYPVTAAVAVMPLTQLSLRAANAVFVGLGAGVLFWALTRETFSNPSLLVFASLTMIVTANTVQWSPFLTSAVFLPSLGFLYACKPSVGIAYLVAYPNPRSWIGAAVFTLLTVVVWPWWPQDWLHQLPTVTHMSAPVARWGGPLLLLALLRWRRPEARLLLALSCVPQTSVLYEAVPLFLVVRRIEEGAILLLLTYLFPPILQTAAGKPYDEWMTFSGEWMVWLLYIPCLIFVLRRPNLAPANDAVAALSRWVSTRWMRSSAR